MAEDNKPQGSQGPTDAEKKAAEEKAKAESDAKAKAEAEAKAKAEEDAKNNAGSDSKGVKMTYIGQFNGLSTKHGMFKKDVTVVMPKKIADELKKTNPGEFKFA